MDLSTFFSPESFWQRDSFRFIKAEEFVKLGIDEADIPLGTFAALKHPSHLPSKFGGNAYGFGLFEAYDRLEPKDIKLLQSITFEEPENIGHNYKALNELYGRIGLLIRYTSLGKPFYLIPVHLASDTLTHIKSKVDEITKVVGFHRKKYLKEYHDIGLVSHMDELISRQLSFRFKEHNFVVIDSIEKLRDMTQTLDLVILTQDIYDIILMDKFNPFTRRMPTKKQVEQFAVYFLWKIYNVLKPNGEIFIISNAHTPKTNRITELVFKSIEEEKLFALFTHIFKTKKRYRPKGEPIQVNIFDLEKYLSGLYVEQEVISSLLKGKNIKEISLDDIAALAYLDFPLSDSIFFGDQEKIWSELLAIHFDKVFLKPLVPLSVTDDWDKRFSTTDYSPKYMMIYLGQKKPLKITLADLMRDAGGSHLLGCPKELLAEHRNSFSYLLKTLRVLERLKKGSYSELPAIFIDRLRQPLINPNQRFSSLNDVLKLVAKIRRIEKAMGYINPVLTEGEETLVLENLEAMAFFGFNYNELKEIIYIVYGHTSFGRIIAGKTSEKAFKPVLDLAQTFDTQQAINFLRFCRLMTMAETEADMGSGLTSEQLIELFDFYESAVRVVTNQGLEWHEVLDEKIISQGGIHNKVVRKILKMMNYYEFTNNWLELGQKGRMEKETLADYDDRRVERIENVIRLVEAIDDFEEGYVSSDPLELPAFYRKILDKEFHGTGNLFERMDSRLVFMLLSITANLSRGEIINFNPLLADVRPEDIKERVRKIEEDTRSITIRYFRVDVLRQFSEQLYRHGSSFILGTGFMIKRNAATNALEIAYIDVEKAIENLKSFIEKIEGLSISKISTTDLKSMEALFADLEIFYQSHIIFLEESRDALKLPSTQKRWFQDTKDLREQLRSNFLVVFFRPADIYTNLDLLFRYTPTVLAFILPEFMSLNSRQMPLQLYMTAPSSHYIISATRKLQSLITNDKELFQDIHFLHKLAQREFGPLATGTVGVSDAQLKELENIAHGLLRNRPLFDAVTRALIFQDLGRLPDLREQYKDDISPAEWAQASAVFVEKEDIAQRYNLDERGKTYLIFLIRHHGLMHHILRGEFSPYALKDVLSPKDKDLFDAFFIFSFVMLSAIRDDLILEDLAGQMFKTRAQCVKIIKGEADFEQRLNRIFLPRGSLYYALEYYQSKGIPADITPPTYLEAKPWREPEEADLITAGKAVFALERIFRLRGIRQIKYRDIVNFIIKVPTKYIYQKRRLSSIGFASFERELFEAYRILNTLQDLREKTRNFIFTKLAGDEVRIFGYEKVSGYLNYENQIKLLLVGLLGTKDFESSERPVCLNFLDLCEKIEKRYEAVNSFLNEFSTDEILQNEKNLRRFFSAKSGVILRKEGYPDVCSIDFVDSVNMVQKISSMAATNDPEQLKSYYLSSLRSITKHPFNTDDYEEQLNQAYQKRLTEITDMILNQTKNQMNYIVDFKELHNLVNDLLERSSEIGFSDDQRHRLNDLYELRKDHLKREKFSEIDGILEMIHDKRELLDYWDSIKPYLQNNRRFFGKEFENIVARKFDHAGVRIG
ncbi:conserved hypothetical protein [uncultured Desulfobacterium sp.]|uniref:Uncharacterized protein n=1 Tax=uncultured Desulfobacterium sp. TaxID=201089 RepID=A0A445MRH9_9BACT|nr:conserved hypothetical protein [uncultured Desulfobacterium sp.]